MFLLSLLNLASMLSFLLLRHSRNFPFFYSFLSANVPTSQGSCGFPNDWHYHDAYDAYYDWQWYWDSHWGALLLIEG
jgi:hypothetical protein